MDCKGWEVRICCLPMAGTQFFITQGLGLFIKAKIQPISLCPGLSFPLPLIFVFSFRKVWPLPRLRKPTPCKCCPSTWPSPNSTQWLMRTPSRITILQTSLVIDSNSQTGTQSTPCYPGPNLQNFTTHWKRTRSLSLKSTIILGPPSALYTPIASIAFLSHVWKCFRSRTCRSYCKYSSQTISIPKCKKSMGCSCRISLSRIQYPTPSRYSPPRTLSPLSPPKIPGIRSPKAKKLSYHSSTQSLF